MTSVNISYIISFAFQQGKKEKYSRGRRGAPAKGVGRATGARVQIPLTPFSEYFFRKVLDKVNHFVIIAWLSRKRTVKSEEKIKKLRGND